MKEVVITRSAFEEHIKVGDYFTVEDLRMGAVVSRYTDCPVVEASETEFTILVPESEDLTK